MLFRRYDNKLFNTTPKRIFLESQSVPYAIDANYRLHLKQNACACKVDNNKMCKMAKPTLFPSKKLKGEAFKASFPSLYLFSFNQDKTISNNVKSNRLNTHIYSF